MHLPTYAASRRKTLTSIAALAITALALIGTVPARAMPASTPTVNPNATVSSDGSTPSAAFGSGMQTVSQAYVPSGQDGAAVNARSFEPAVPPVRAPGSVSTESVIGTDNRVRVTSTTSYPYRAIVHITSSIGGCTGWLINANTVVTAGHCVHNGNWASNVRVYPGRNGSSTPYGSCTSRRLYSVTGWTSSRNRNYDYGAIKLNCSIGNTVGWFGYRWTSSSLNGQTTNLAGYPGDKAYGTMWRHTSTVRISQTYRLYYANDTAGGQSGSPVWNSSSGCSNCAIAIHAYGVDSTGYNGGTRITQSVFNNLTTWKNAP